MNRIIIASITIATVVGISTLGSCIAFYDTANTLENAATAQAKSNRAHFDNMWKTVAEVAQVPSQYKADFQDLVTAETTAKFGPEGSDAMAQWFTERDLRLPPEIYIKVQTVIEAERATFTQGQDLLADKQRRYADHLGTVGGQMWSGVTGHPKPVSGKYAPTEDLDGDGVLTVLDYPIITSAKTEAVFAEGRDDKPINVFGKGGN